MRTSLLRLDREYEEEQEEYVQGFQLHLLTDRELILKVYTQQQQILVGQAESKGGQAQTNLLLAGLSNRVKTLEDNRNVVPSSAGSKYTLSSRLFILSHLHSCTLNCCFCFAVLPGNNSWTASPTGRRRYAISYIGWISSTQWQS